MAANLPPLLKAKKGREGFIQGLRQESSRSRILEAAHKKEILEWGKTRW